jgi:hypothetical protein
MRTHKRSASLIVAVLMGAGSLLAHQGGLALAETNEDRTDSEAYTDARADYWEARAAYAARRAARAAQRAAEGAGEIAEAPAPAPEPAVAEPAPLVPGGPTNEQLAALRWCESNDNYYINTGNGYYGAYQFSPITWWWLGYGGYPHEAAPAVQDEAARYLHSIFGWTPWPACSSYLGFR